jgi:hypothetical protein
MSSFSASDMFVTRTFFSTDVIIEVPCSLNLRDVYFSDLHKSIQKFLHQIIVIEMSGDTRRTRARSKNAVRKSSEGERKNGDALRNGKSKRLDFALDTKGTTRF